MLQMECFLQYVFQSSDWETAHSQHLEMEGDWTRFCPSLSVGTDQKSSLQVDLFGKSAMLPISQRECISGRNWFEKRHHTVVFVELNYFRSKNILSIKKSLHFQSLLCLKVEMLSMSNVVWYHCSICNNPSCAGLQINTCQPSKCDKKLTLLGNIETLLANMAIILVFVWSCSAPPVRHHTTTGYKLMVTVCVVEYALHQRNKKAAEKKRKAADTGGNETKGGNKEN